MAHHGSNLGFQSSLGELLDDERIGPTGQFPRGKINADDEGEIKIAVAADAPKGLVLVHFGSPVTWIGFTAEQASSLADLIQEKSLEARGIKS